MGSRAPLIVCAATGAIVALAANERQASAAEPHGARWYVDVSGDKNGGCAGDRDAFEHEVSLACAAMGTCTIVGDAKKAELVATLHCYGYRDPWTLEVRTVEGALVSSTDMTGAREDRFREAAIEVARDQAPERTLAAASLRDTLPDGDRVKKPWKLPSMSLAFGGAAAIGGVEQTSGGARAAVGMLVVESTHLTLGLTGLMGGSDQRVGRHLRTGVGFSFGAPFTASWIGAAFEGGVDLSQSYLLDGGYDFSRRAQTHAGPYGQGGLVLAVPLRQVRPFLGFAFGGYAEPKTTAYATFDAGLALPLF